MSAAKLLKIAITGGPSGGKTTLAQAIAREYGHRVSIVPEAATLIFAGGWPRRKHSTLVRYQQRAIYFVQREIEGLYAEENPSRMLICDRGSLDSLAYWPGTDEEFFQSIRTSLEHELGRYPCLLHMETAPVEHYDTTNPIRTEPYEEAIRLDNRIKQAWSAHPQRFVIGNHDGHFFSKLHQALWIVERILDGATHAQILHELQAWSYGEVAKK